MQPNRSNTLTFNKRSITVEGRVAFYERWKNYAVLSRDEVGVDVGSLAVEALIPKYRLPPLRTELCLAAVALRPLDIVRLAERRSLLPAKGVFAASRVVAQALALEYREPMAIYRQLLAPHLPFDPQMAYVAGWAEVHTHANLAVRPTHRLAGRRRGAFTTSFHYAPPAADDAAERLLQVVEAVAADFR